MKWILTALFACAIPVGASAADFAGTWKVTLADPSGVAPKTIGSMIFDLKIIGSEVVGLAHVGVWPGLAPVAEGRVDGDHISFTATGYLPSTTGTPTCRIEGTLTGDELVIRLSQIWPGSGAVFEYRGGRLDAAAARAEKLRALATLSVHREYPKNHILMSNRNRPLRSIPPLRPVPRGSRPISRHGKRSNRFRRTPHASATRSWTI